MALKRSRCAAPRATRSATGVAAVLAAFLLSCDAGGGTDRALPGGSAVEYGSGVVRIETASDAYTLQVEVAEEPEQRTQGLMERLELDDDAGMIFLFEREQPVGAGFYMFRTRIPLDIAFLDGEGRIVSILAMEPCTSPNPSTCPRYSPGVPYMAALEVNRGYFERRGIGEGDRVTLERSDGEPWPPASRVESPAEDTGSPAPEGYVDARS